MRFGWLLLVLANCCYGCELLPIDTRALQNPNSIVVVGYVAGERFPNYEKRVIEGADPELIEVPEYRQVLVVVKERKSGTSADAIWVSGGCDITSPRVFERVVLVRAPNSKYQLLFGEDLEDMLEEIAGVMKQ